MSVGMIPKINENLLSTKGVFLWLQEKKKPLSDHLGFFPILKCPWCMQTHLWHSTSWVQHAITTSYQVELL